MVKCISALIDLPFWIHDGTLAFWLAVSTLFGKGQRAAFIPASFPPGGEQLAAGPLRGFGSRPRWPSAKTVGSSG